MHRQDIRDFKAANNCDRIVVLWAASTEIYVPLSDEHQSLAALEKAMKENNTEVISPSMCYAYAAIAEGAPFIMGAPNLCVDTPAMWEFSKKMNVPISGKDFKSGQTLMKTVLAPMFKTRMLGVSGWFSTNILGNRDGEVLDDPDNFKTKEVSKLSVIDNIFEPEKYPDLYGDVYHKVRINYYPPRKDNKEAWDNIDIFGWMGYPMEIKVNFLCRDSILAAPIALDLVLFSDLAMRAGMSGIQTWLSFFCKSPMHDLESQLIFRLIYSSAVWFLKYLKQINIDISAAEKELERSIRNEDLLRLMRLQKTLVYFNTSIRGNEVMIGKLRTIFQDTDYLDTELVEDVIIELKQALNTVNIYSDILTGTMDAFASIISNNVNTIMKRMTSLSIVLMLPTLIASFYGMNVDIHLEEVPFAFSLIVLFSIGLSTLAFVIFRKIKWF